MKYGIICAMEEEFSLVKKLIKEPKITVNYGREFIEGKIENSEVVAVISRIGKVAAAITTYMMIYQFKADAVIFCGIAGAIADDVSIGDIVISDKCFQHDLYLSDTDIFRIPLLNVSFIDAAADLTQKMKNACEDFCEEFYSIKPLKDFADELNIKSPKIHIGTVASGDQFISDPERKKWIKEHAENVKCVEMEGAAVAQVCYETSVPFTIVRVISDSADNGADYSFERFLDSSKLYSSEIIRLFCR